VAVVLLLVILVIVLVVVLRGRPRNYISLSGIVEATQVVLSSKVNARVAGVFVDEGDQVRRGKLLVRLRDVEFREQVAQAEAAVEAAQARLNDALAGARPEEIRQARAQVEQAEANLAGARRSLTIAEENFERSRQLQAQLQAAETNLRTSEAAYEQAQALERRASEDYRRAQILYERGAIPASQLDAARAAAESAAAQVQQTREAVTGARRTLEIARRQYEERTAERQQLTAARTQYEAAQAQLRAAEARLEEILAGARPEQIEQLRAQVRQAEAALAQAQTQLENTTAEAPISGTILTRAVEPGELATVGSTLIEMADLSSVELHVYVEEPVYGRLHLGQTAAVTVDSYPNRVFRGRVTQIAQEAEFTPKEIQTQEERAKLVFEVTITIPNPHGMLKPGMPADAILQLQPASG
jgi:HlyD family secretion protein